MRADDSGAPVVWVAAGEASGDQLGAALVQVLRTRHPAVRFRGLAGPRMRAEGVEPVAHAEEATAFGLVEVVGAIPRLSRLLDTLTADVRASDPEVVVTIDSPDLLLRLGERLRARGVPVVHWVCPQVWAWRGWRVRRLGRQASTVLCLLPFEAGRLLPHVRAVYVGHPAARPPASLPAVPEAGGRPRVALLPGSRPSELDRHWPVLREVARHLRRRWPSASFVVPRAPGVSPRPPTERDRGRRERRLTGLDAVFVDDVWACRDADVAVAASGTVTLQLAAMDVPMVVIYRVHPLTFAIARRLAAHLRFVALPNLLAGQAVVPEFVQELPPLAIAEAAASLVGRRGQVPREIVGELGGEQAIERVAGEVSRWFRGRPGAVRDS